MNKKLMRFKVIKDDTIIDAYLDDRLSFKDNFKYLKNIVEIDDDYKIYDPNKKVFLNNEIPIEVFNINSYMLMYLFWTCNRKPISNYFTVS